MRKRRVLAAPFVVTVALHAQACAPKASQTGGTAVQRDDGTCWLSYDMDCGPNQTCNPPPPKQIPPRFCPKSSEDEE
jgi:hypothetical protein